MNAKDKETIRMLTLAVDTLAGAMFMDLGERMHREIVKALKIVLNRLDA